MPSTGNASANAATTLRILLLTSICHQLHRHHAGGLAVGPQAAAHRITERQHRGVGVLGPGQVPGHRYAVAVAVVTAALLRHRVRLAAVGVVPQRIAPGAEQPHRRLAVELGEIADGVDPATVQPLGRTGADTEQIAHRQRPHLLFDLVSI